MTFLHHVLVMPVLVEIHPLHSSQLLPTGPEQINSRFRSPLFLASNQQPTSNLPRLGAWTLIFRLQPDPGSKTCHWKTYLLMFVCVSYNLLHPWLLVRLALWSQRRQRLEADAQRHNIQMGPIRHSSMLDLLSHPDSSTCKEYLFTLA